MPVIRCRCSAGFHQRTRWTMARGQRRPVLRHVSHRVCAITDDVWTPVHYPGAVFDPDAGELIFDAEVAETTFTAFESTAPPGHRAADGAPGP
jgi:hypothetical protein